MHRNSWLLTILLIGLLNSDSAHGQRRDFGPIRAGSNLDLANARISEQRVNRQTEIARLEDQLRRFESRIVLLERKSMRSPLPAITLTEARAAVDYAKAQLQETEKRFEEGDASELQVKGDQLALARANGQLISATAAHAESRILLELDVTYAEKNYRYAANEREQMQRFVAKGYTSSSVFQRSEDDYNLAEKQLRLARLRLKTAQQLASEEVVGVATTSAGNQTETPSPEALPIDPLPADAPEVDSPAANSPTSDAPTIRATPAPN